MTKGVPPNRGLIESIGNGTLFDESAEGNECGDNALKVCLSNWSAYKLPKLSETSRRSLQKRFRSLAYGYLVKSGKEYVPKAIPLSTIDKLSKEIARFEAVWSDKEHRAAISMASRFLGLDADSPLKTQQAREFRLSQIAADLQSIRKGLVDLRSASARKGRTSLPHRDFLIKHLVETFEALAGRNAAHTRRAAMDRVTTTDGRSISTKRFISQDLNFVLDGAVAIDPELTHGAVSSALEKYFRAQHKASNKKNLNKKTAA